MRTVEFLRKLYVVEGSVGAPDEAIFLDTLPSDKLVELRNLLTSNLDLGRDIKMFQSKAKGIKLVTDLLVKWEAFDPEDEVPSETEPEFNDDLPDEMQPTPEADAEPMEPAPAGPTGKVRDGSKQAALIDLLKRPEGASIKEIAEALNWLNHTVRGAISRDLKKRLGLPVTKSRVEGRGQVYRIEA